MLIFLKKYSFLCLINSKSKIAQLSHHIWEQLDSCIHEIQEQNIWDSMMIYINQLYDRNSSHIFFYNLNKF